MTPSDIEKLKGKAAKGSTASQIQLGHSYLTGTSYDGSAFPQDYGEARRWLEMAHDKGAHTATVLLGSIYENGQGVSVNTSAAISLYEAAAKLGSFLACIYLGRIYANGLGVEQSRSQASKWYQEALSHDEEIDLQDEIDEARSYLANE